MIFHLHTLLKKSLYSELFWSAFFRIRSRYGEIRSIFLYSVQMRENAGKIRTRIMLNTDTFYAVIVSCTVLLGRNGNYKRELFWNRRNDKCLKFSYALTHGNRVRTFLTPFSLSSISLWNVTNWQATNSPKFLTNHLLYRSNEG